MGSGLFQAPKAPITIAPEPEPLVDIEAEARRANRRRASRRTVADLVVTPDMIHEGLNLTGGNG